MPETSTLKPVTDAVKQAVKDVSSQITALSNDITGKFKQTFSQEMSEVVSWGENVFGKIKHVFSPFFKSISQWFLQTKLMKTSTSILKKILGIEKKREQRERAGLGIKAKSLFDKLLPILSTGFGLIFTGLGAMLGAILGPFIAPFTEPFRVIIKSWQKLQKYKPFEALTKFMKNPFGIRDMIKKPKILADLFEWFKGLQNLIPKSLVTAANTGIRWFKKMFGWIGKIGKFIASSFGTGFLKGFLKSVNKIFWPIQIIMSVVDFIKGFQETKGDIFDKLVGGVKNVLKEFFGFPIKIIGMLVDWVAKQFGFENLGAKDALVDAFNKLLDIGQIIVVGIKDFFVKKVPEIFKRASGLLTGIDNLLQPLWDFFGRIRDALIKGIWNYINESPLLSKLIKGIGAGGLLKSLEDQVKEIDLREKDEIEKEKIKLMKEQNAKLDKVIEKTDGSKQQINAVTGANNSGHFAVDKTDTSVDTLFAIGQ